MTPPPLPQSRRRIADGLRAGLDKPLTAVAVGRGSALALTGWCYHPRHAVTGVELLLDGRATPADLYGARRRDLLARFGPDVDPYGYCEYSGFAGVVPVPACHQARSADLAIRAALADGSSRTTPLAVPLLTPDRRADAPVAVGPDRPPVPARVAVCIATYNPPPALFERQVATLRAQSFRDWTCVICDDHSRVDTFARVLNVVGGDRRFRVYRQPANVGFYHNFEHCLALAPAGSEFVALCDQDDAWHRDKLATLVAHFGPRTNLVYSDLRVVGADGRVRADTYWTTRRPNAGDLTGLLIANAITGAAAMIRRRLLDYALPFPDACGPAFHDHWLACAALATGDVRYVPRPLYDYVQHDGNVIGHFAPPAVPVWARVWRWLKFAWPPKVADNLRVALGNGRANYFDNDLRIRQLALALLTRCGAGVPAAKRRALAAWGSPFGLLLRGFRHPSGVSPTVGMEFHLLHARLWATYARARAAVCAGRRPAASAPVPVARAA